MNPAHGWALTLMLAGGLFAWWLVNRTVERPDRAFIARVVAATFALRVLWSVFQHIIYPRAWPMFAADAIARYNIGRRNAELWRDGVMSPELPRTLAEAHEGLIQLQTTTLIYLFGPSPMLPEAITITLNVTVVIAVYLICRHIGAIRRAARTAAVFAAFLPSLVFWSTQNVKDPITATAVAWATLAMLKVTRDAHGGYMLLLIGANMIALVYRPYVGILLIVGQGLAWAATVRLPKTALGTVLRVSMFVVMVPIVLHVGVREMQQTYGEHLDLGWAVDQYTGFRQAGIDRGGVQGSEYAIPLTADTPTQAVLQLPLRVLLLLLSPIPLFPGAFRRMLLYPEMWFVYIYIVPRFGAGIREAWTKNRSALISILVILLPLIVSYALKTAVSGEAVRMRSQFVPVLLVFAGVGHAVYRRRKARRGRRTGAPSPAEQYREAGSEAGRQAGS